MKLLLVNHGKFNIKKTLDIAIRGLNSLSFPPSRSDFPFEWPHSSLGFASFLPPFFVPSGLSTIRSHFSISFVWASSSISVSSLQPSVAFYVLCWKLYSHIPCTTLPIRPYVCYVCNIGSRPSTFYIYRTASA